MLNGLVWGNRRRGWVFSSSGENFSLDVLSGTGHAGPAHTIIGAPAVDNKYDGAGGSIAGNGPHNPFLALSVVFQFSLTCVDELPNVTASTFQFRTADGQGQPAPKRRSAAEAGVPDRFWPRG